MNQYFAQAARREEELSRREGIQTDDPDPDQRSTPEYGAAADRHDGVMKDDVKEGAGKEGAAKLSLLSSMRDWVREMLGQKPSDTGLKEVFAEMLEEHEEAAERLTPQGTQMLRNMLSFGDITVRDIMIPRTDILAVQRDVSLESLKKHVIEFRHTRIPVYRDSLDQVEGFVHTKDLLPILAGDEEFSLSRVLRPMLFVPPSMRVIDLLVKMRRIGAHMAIVVDEYGGTDGLVTLEDVFEEIVGDIQDEHDEEYDREYTRISPEVAEVDAKIRIEKLEDMLGLKLRGDDDAEFDTLGGLIFYDNEEVPPVGAVIGHDSGLSFEVLDADARRVKKVRIHNIPQHDSESVG